MPGWNQDVEMKWYIHLLCWVDPFMLSFEHIHNSSTQLWTALQ